MADLKPTGISGEVGCHTVKQLLVDIPEGVVVKGYIVLAVLSNGRLAFSTNIVTANEQSRELRERMLQDGLRELT